MLLFLAAVLRADYDYTVIYREKQGGGSTFRFLSPPWCVCTRLHYLTMPGGGCQLRVDAAARDVVRWATGGPPALAAYHHGGRAPNQLPEMQRPRRGEGAARRARPEPAPGALLAHHPANPAGVAGRIGGTPPGGAAPPPHLGSGWGPGWSLARIEQNITVLYAGRAMAGRAPAHHPHAFSPPEPGPGGLANCGVTGLCTRHRPGGAPAIIQNNLFCSDRARPGQRLNLWRRRFPWLAERPALWGCIRRTPRPGARGGGEWGADLAHHPGSPAGVVGRPSGPPPGGAGPGWAKERPGGPGRSQSPGSGAWGEGAARRAWPEPAAPGSPLWGAGGGSPGRYT